MCLVSVSFVVFIGGVGGRRFGRSFVTIVVCVVRLVFMSCSVNKMASKWSDCLFQDKWSKSCLPPAPRDGIPITHYSPLFLFSFAFPSSEKFTSLDSYSEFERLRAVCFLYGPNTVQ